jgi:hypothetical protein
LQNKCPSKFFDGNELTSLFEQAEDLTIGKSELFHGRYSPKLVDLISIISVLKAGAAQIIRPPIV